MPTLHVIPSHFTDFLFQLLQGHAARLKHWVLMGFALLLLGIILHFTHGVN
jgi:heparan-alpha-glucosaminide N-acetyltransferase